MSDHAFRANRTVDVRNEIRKRISSVSDMRCDRIFHGLLWNLVILSFKCEGKQTEARLAY